MGKRTAVQLNLDYLDLFGLQKIIKSLDDQEERVLSGNDLNLNQSSDKI